MNDLKVRSKDGITEIWLDGNKLDMVKSISLCQNAGQPMPLVKLEIYADADIECQNLGSRLIKKSSKATQ